MTTTTIRVNLTTRDRLNALLADRFKGMTADDLIQHLLDEDWKADCIASWDKFREEDPQGWQDYLAEADQFDRQLGPTLPEEPYESDDPDWIATGGAPLTKDAA